jgi:hypothetical protein
MKKKREIFIKNTSGVIPVNIGMALVMKAFHGVEMVVDIVDTAHLQQDARTKYQLSQLHRNTNGVGSGAKLTMTVILVASSANG